MELTFVSSSLLGKRLTTCTTVVNHCQWIIQAQIASIRAMYGQLLHHPLIAILDVCHVNHLIQRLQTWIKRHYFKIEAKGHCSLSLWSLVRGHGTRALLSPLMQVADRLDKSHNYVI
jgi:hypothetical protein